MTERKVTNEELAGRIDAMQQEKSTENALAYRPDWMTAHEADDQRNFDAINKRLDELPNEIHKVIIASLITGGGRVKTGIIVTATLIGALVTIGVGVKFFLGLIGFTYLSPRL